MTFLLWTSAGRVNGDHAKIVRAASKEALLRKLIKESDYTTKADDYVIEPPPEGLSAEADNLDDFEDEAGRHPYRSRGEMAHLPHGA